MLYIVCNIKTQCIIDFQGFWKEYDFSQKMMWLHTLMREKKIFCFTSLLSGNAGSGSGSFSLFFSILETFFFAVLGRSEVSDSRVPVEMVRTEYNVQKWQVDILHTALVTPAITLPWHSFMPRFVLVVFVHWGQKLAVTCPYIAQCNLSEARLE